MEEISHNIHIIQGNISSYKIVHTPSSTKDSKPVGSIKVRIMSCSDEAIAALNA